MLVSWFSCGCSSFLATYLIRDRVDKIIYTHVPQQHPDTLRFLKDSEKYLGNIEVLQCDYYRSIYDVFRARRFINSPYGAPCTTEFKRKVRKDWEIKNPGRHTYVWGFDCTERKRADRIIENMPQYDHIFPLIENNLDKSDVHGYCEKLGIRRPYLYDLGYPNNNCVGCVKGGMGYWNKIRIDFPAVFDNMANLELELGCTVLNGIRLIDLPSDVGRNNPVLPACDIFCQLFTGENDTIL